MRHISWITFRIKSIEAKLNFDRESLDSSVRKEFQIDVDYVAFSESDTDQRRLCHSHSAVESAGTFPKGLPLQKIIFENPRERGPFGGIFRQNFPIGKACREQSRRYLVWGMTNLMANKSASSKHLWCFIGWKSCFSLLNPELSAGPIWNFVAP